MAKSLRAFFSLVLFLYFHSALGGTPFVRVETNQGAFTLQLDSGKAPISVANFLTYVNEGFYVDTLFHRSPKNFVVQGGGFDATKPLKVTAKSTHAAIVNEATNGLSNVRGTVAMARTDQPNSATSQFFVNVVDNRFLDHSATQAGYAVFGKVVAGMEIVDAINALPVAKNIDPTVPQVFQDMPVKKNAQTGKYDFVSIENTALLLPVADAGKDFPTEAGARVTLDGSGSSDPTPGAAQPLLYEWKQVAGPRVDFSAGADGPNPVFIAPSVTANAVLSFELSVINAYGNRSTNAAVINVTAKVKNNPPVADAGAGGTVRAGGSLTLHGAGSYDPDSDPLSFAWTAPAGILLSNPSDSNPSLLVPVTAAGQTLNFSLTVSDGPLSSTRAVAYQVVANGAPQVTIAAPSQVDAGDAVTLTATASDPEGDTIGYRWQQIGGTAVSLTATDGASLSFTAPNAGAAESLQFSVTVTDTGSPSPSAVTATAAVSVNAAANQLPLSPDPNRLVCSRATASPAILWPPKRGLRPVAVAGITGPHPYSISITGVQSDEPVKSRTAQDATGPDAIIRKGKATSLKPTPDDTLLLRAERQIQRKRAAVANNGRVYTIAFSATDGEQTCTGLAQVAVPVQNGAAAVNDGTGYNALKRR